MARRSDRRRRWASVSALASAAIAASSGSGEAAIIYHSAHWVGPNATLPLPGGNQISVFSRAQSRFGFINTTVPREILGPKGNVRTFFQQGGLVSENDGRVDMGGVAFRRLAGTGTFRPLALAGKGQTFKQVGSEAGSARLGSDFHVLTRNSVDVFYMYGPRLHHFPFWYSRGVHRFGPTFRQNVWTRTNGATHNGVGSISFRQYNYRTGYSLAGYGTQYALFSFDVGSQTDYGWLELSLGGSPGSAPFVRLIGYAYDTSGKQIPAGAIPEPKHLPLALGALALGAVGVREWRKKRNATA